MKPYRYFRREYSPACIEYYRTRIKNINKYSRYYHWCQSDSPWDNSIEGRMPRKFADESYTEISYEDLMLELL